MSLDIIPIAEDKPGFAGFPSCPDLESLDADVAVIGVMAHEGQIGK